MSFIVYKVEKNADSFYWNGNEWSRDVKKRKVFDSKKDATNTAKKLNGSIFPEEEIKRTAEHNFHGTRNLLPYSTMKEYNSHRKLRWDLLRTDCTFVGATPEIRFKAWTCD